MMNKLTKIILTADSYDGAGCTGKFVVLIFVRLKILARYSLDLLPSIEVFIRMSINKYHLVESLLAS